MTFDLKSFVESLDLSSDGLFIEHVGLEPADQNTVTARVSENTLKNSDAQKTKTFAASEWIAVLHNPETKSILVSMRIDLGRDSKDGSHFDLLVKIANQINYFGTEFVSKVLICRNDKSRDITGLLSFTARIAEIEEVTGSALSDAALRTILSRRVIELYHEKAIAWKNFHRIMKDHSMRIERGMQMSSAVH